MNSDQEDALRDALSLLQEELHKLRTDAEDTYMLQTALEETIAASRAALRSLEENDADYYG